MAHDTRSRNEFVARRPRTERRRIAVRWGIAIAIILAFAGIVYLVRFTGVLNVASVTIAGNRLSGDAVVTRSVVNMIASRSWVSRMVGEGNILFWLRAPEVQGKELQEPAINSVSVHVDILKKTILIEVREREFVGAWCAERCVGFDENGIAYFDAPESQGSLLLVIEDASTTTPILGERVLEDEQQFNNMIATIKGVKSAGIAIERVAVRDHYLREWAITPVHGGTMLFSFDVVPERLGSVLKTIMERAKWESLNYIDFRVANRVYYK